MRIDPALRVKTVEQSKSNVEPVCRKQAAARQSWLRSGHAALEGEKDEVGAAANAEFAE
jgi:hypothetical protein